MGHRDASKLQPRFGMRERWCFTGPGLATRTPHPASRFHRFLHLFRTYITDMRADRPLMTEWVFHFSVAIAPEHVVERHRDLCAGAHRLLEGGVGIFDVEMDNNR